MSTPEVSPAVVDAAIVSASDGDGDGELITAAGLDHLFKLTGVLADLRARYQTDTL